MKKPRGEPHFHWLDRWPNQATPAIRQVAASKTTPLASEFNPSCYMMLCFDRRRARAILLGRYRKWLEAEHNSDLPIDPQEISR